MNDKHQTTDALSPPKDKKTTSIIINIIRARELRSLIFIKILLFFLLRRIGFPPEFRTATNQSLSRVSELSVFSKEKVIPFLKNYLYYVFVLPTEIATQGLT